MNKKLIQRSFLLVAIVLLAVILMSSMIGIVTTSAYASESLTENAVEDNSAEEQVKKASYEIRPIIDWFSYNLYEVIPVEIFVDADSPIVSVDYASLGFDITKSLSVKNDKKVESGIIYNNSSETPQFTVYVKLSNGIRLQADIYGFVADKKIYINANSLFGAKDIYWADMLDSEAKTQTEYETYITNREPNLSIEISKMNQDTVSPMATKYNVTISGTLQWRDDWGNVHPLQYTKVKIMDEGGGWLFGWWDTELGTTYTNQNGRYSLSFTHSGTCNPYLKIYPEGENTVVKTGSGKEYVRQTETRNGITTGTTIDDIITMEDEVGRAFQISQAVIAASRFVNVVYGKYVDTVTVKYPHNENSTGCFYSSDVVYIVGNRDNDTFRMDGQILRSYASWDVIQHEFFHHVQSKLNITDNPGGWHVPSTNMYVHYMSHHSVSYSSVSCLDENGNVRCANPTIAKAKDAAIKLAYAEAVPSVLGAIAQQYFTNRGILNNIRTVGDAIYNSYNGVVMNYEYISNRIGEVGETTVNAILWDIYDDANETNDTIALGYQKFWEVLIKNNNKTFSDFMSSLSETNPFYIESLGANLTYYNFAPTLETIKNNELYELPTFDWIPNGSDSATYQNNRFEVVFYNRYQVELFSKTVTTTSYTLTESEWNTILSQSGDYFYWAVKGSHSDPNSNLITGPYLSESARVMKPTGTVLAAGGSVDGTISSVARYREYKFVAPTSGTYTFYTEGELDTYGDVFSTPIYGLSNANRLAYNDDSGAGLNFKIVVELDYNQTIYIRVRAYSSSATGSYTLYAELNEHIHHYNASCKPNDTDTHRRSCDCGLYYDEEHDWISVGTNKMRCLECMLTCVGEIPGGSIMSVGDETDDYYARQ